MAENYELFDCAEVKRTLRTRGIQAEILRFRLWWG